MKDITSDLIERGISFKAILKVSDIKRLNDLEAGVLNSETKAEDDFKMILKELGVMTL